MAVMPLPFQENAPRSYPHKCQQLGEPSSGSTPDQCPEADINLLKQYHDLLAPGHFMAKHLITGAYQCCRDWCWQVLGRLPLVSSFLPIPCTLAMLPQFFMLSLQLLALIELIIKHHKTTKYPNNQAIICNHTIKTGHRCFPGFGLATMPLDWQAKEINGRTTTPFQSGTCHWLLFLMLFVSAHTPSVCLTLTTLCARVMQPLHWLTACYLLVKPTVSWFVAHCLLSKLTK